MRTTEDRFAGHSIEYLTSRASSSGVIYVFRASLYSYQFGLDVLIYPLKQLDTSCFIR